VWLQKFIVSGHVLSRLTILVLRATIKQMRFIKIKISKMVVPPVSLNNVFWDRRWCRY
jgi:hypothetical protein